MFSEDHATRPSGRQAAKARESTRAPSMGRYAAEQEGNLSAILEDMAAAYTGGIHPEFSGNCAIDYEGWNNIVTVETFGSCVDRTPPRRSCGTTA